MNTGKTVQRFDDSTAVAATLGLNWQQGPDYFAVLQFELTAGTVTFRLQGRLSPDAPWADLTVDITDVSTRVQPIARATPEMRVNVTAIGGGGTLRVWVMA